MTYEKKSGSTTPATTLNADDVLETTNITITDHGEGRYSLVDADQRITFLNAQIEDLLDYLQIRHTAREPRLSYQEELSAVLAGNAAAKSYVNEPRIDLDLRKWTTETLEINFARNSISVSLDGEIVGRGILSQELYEAIHPL